VSAALRSCGPGEARASLGDAWATALQAWGVLAREGKPLCVDSATVLGRAIRRYAGAAYVMWNIQAQLKIHSWLARRGHEEKRRRRRKHLRTTSLRHAPPFLHSTPSLLLLIYRPPSLFCSSTFSSPEERCFSPGTPRSTSRLSAHTCRTWSPIPASRLAQRRRQRLRQECLRRQPALVSLRWLHSLRSPNHATLRAFTPSSALLR